MEELDVAALADGAVVLVDTAPIIYVLESHPKWAARFEPLFAAHGEGRLSLVVSTITIAEVLAGPFSAGEEALARRYRGVLESWRVVELTSEVAEQAARLRAKYRLKLPDAVQLASALVVNAEAVVTHDRDFGKVRGLRIMS